MTVTLIFPVLQVVICYANSSTKTANAKLVTYREICERLGDCIESASAGSLLSHTFNWSQFIAAEKMKRSTLELISLGAPPLSEPSSPSRLIAHVGDILNSMGLKNISNAVALLLTMPSLAINPECH